MGAGPLRLVLGATLYGEAIMAIRYDHNGRAVGYAQPDAGPLNRRGIYEDGDWSVVPDVGETMSVLNLCPFRDAPDHQEAAR